jgi:hypothetical protein
MAKSSYGDWSDQERNRFNTYGQEGNKKAQDYMLNNGTGGSVGSGVPYQTTGARNFGGAFNPNYSAPAPSPLDRYKNKSMFPSYGNNGQVAIDQNNNSTDYNSMALNPYEKIWGAGVSTGSRLGTVAKQENEKGFFDGMGGNIRKGIDSLGAKDYGALALGAWNAYTGYKTVQNAEKQHGLAREAFSFQKAAYNEDLAGRKLAYNTNADNVNAWKQAQGRTDLNKLMV